MIKRAAIAAFLAMPLFGIFVGAAGPAGGQPGLFYAYAVGRGAAFASSPST